MKTLKTEDLIGLQTLSYHELTQISGRNWLEDVAYAVGFAIGYVARAVINGFSLITGNGYV